MIDLLQQLIIRNNGDHFLFGNFDKRPRSIALFLSQNFTYNLIFFSEVKTMVCLLFAQQPSQRRVVDDVSNWWPLS